MLVTEEGDYAGWDWVEPFDDRFNDRHCCCDLGCDHCKETDPDHYCKSTEAVCLGFFFDNSFSDPDCFIGRDVRMCGGLKFIPQLYYTTVPLSGWTNWLDLEVLNGPSEALVSFSDFDQIVNVQAEGNITFTVDTMPVLQEAGIFTEASSGVVWDGSLWHYSPSVNKVFENSNLKLGFFKNIAGATVVDQTTLSTSVVIEPIACKHVVTHVDENIIRYDQLLNTQNIGDFLNGLYTVDSWRPLRLEATYAAASLFTFAGRYKGVNFEASKAAATFVGYFTNSVCQASSHPVEATYTNTEEGLVVVELNHTAVASFIGVVGRSNTTFQVQTLEKGTLCMISSITSCLEFTPTCHNERDPVRSGDGEDAADASSSGAVNHKWVIIIVVIVVVALLCCCCALVLAVILRR